MSCEDYYPDWGQPLIPTQDAPYRLVLDSVGDGTQIVGIWNDLTGHKVDEYRVYNISMAEEDNPWNETERRKK